MSTTPRLSKQFGKNDVKTSNFLDIMRLKKNVPMRFLARIEGATLTQKLNLKI